MWASTQAQLFPGGRSANAACYASERTENAANEAQECNYNYIQAYNYLLSLVKALPRGGSLR